VRAIDTNIIVRLLTADDVKQAKVARTVIEAGDVFIGSTVVLETEWVLRVGYRFTPEEIARGLRGLFGLTAVTLEEPAAIGLALDWMSKGMDFADALHVARAGHCNAFLSFDRNLVRRSKGVTLLSVDMP
jgi:predicted nucleic-acid-binding protein